MNDGAGLGTLLETATEEQLHSVLEALAALVAAAPATTAAWEASIAPHILAVWRANITDPLVTSSALDVLSSLATNAETLPKLQVWHTQLSCCQGVIQPLRSRSIEATLHGSLAVCCSEDVTDGRCHSGMFDFSASCRLC